MAALTFIRHGATIQNDSGIFMGRLDFPCREEAIAAAQSAGASLKGKGFTHFLTSPLVRCVSTAQALAPHVNFQIDKRLIERCLGVWSGKKKCEIIASCPDAFLASGRLAPRSCPPEGESLERLAERVLSFLTEVSELPEDSHVLAITHNGVIGMFRCILERPPVEVAFATGEPHLVPFTIEVTPAKISQAIHRIKASFLSDTEL